MTEEQKKKYNEDLEHEKEQQKKHEPVSKVNAIISNLLKLNL